LHGFYQAFKSLRKESQNAPKEGCAGGEDFAGPTWQQLEEWNRMRHPLSSQGNTSLTRYQVGLANVGKSTLFQAITKCSLGNPAVSLFRTLSDILLLIWSRISHMLPSILRKPVLSFPMRATTGFARNTTQNPEYQPI